MTRIHYDVQIFESPDQATAGLEAFAGERVIDREDISWEDRLNKEGQKVGRLLVKSSVRREGDSILGFCSLSYAKDAMLISIFHGEDCDAAREFLKDLTAVTD